MPRRDRCHRRREALEAAGVVAFVAAVEVVAFVGEVAGVIAFAGEAVGVVT